MAENMEALFELAHLCTFPMAAKAAILLQVPEILSSGPLTARQIADRIPGPATSEAKLDRLLLALATYRLFDVSGSNPRTFSLNPMSKLLVKDENGVCLKSMFLLNTDISHLQTLQNLHEAILDEAVVPFEKTFGQPVYHYFGQNSKLGEVFHDAFSNLSESTMRCILERYDGFKDVKVLLDVGGGSGLNCRLIKAAHPHISAINYDMPFVVAKAPQIPGVEHRGGSMFEFVPSGGDTILLKTVLHNWDDVGSGKILKNCLSALPSSGKLIIIETLLGEEIDASSASRLAATTDMAMMTVFKGGKERTAGQFKELVESAGFREFKVAVHGGFLSVMEACKP